MKIIISFLITVLFIGALSAQEIYKSDGQFYQNGKPYTGIIKDYYDNGNLYKEFHFKDGVPHGKCFVYYENGKVKEQHTYELGVKNGTWLNYNHHGEIVAEANYLDGKKHGIWVIKDNKAVKRYEIFYENGKRTGNWKMWNENGNLAMEKDF